MRCSAHLVIFHDSESTLLCLSGRPDTPSSEAWPYRSTSRALPYLGPVQLRARPGLHHLMLVAAVWLSLMPT